MADKTGIEWTNATWNPVTGCAKVSQGCKNCYALRDWPRLAAVSSTVYYGRKFTDVQCHPERLDQPLRWKRPRMIFVNSMSDLFHEDVPFEFIDQVFAVMAMATRHTFQVLTKRPERMREYLSYVNRAEAIGWAETELFGRVGKLPAGAYLGPTHRRLPIPNVWLGVSVEDQATADERIPLLLETPAAVRWLSIEPLLGPVSLRWLSAWPENAPTSATNPYNGGRTDHLDGLRRLDWVVVGGESGPKARPMHPDWVRTLRDQCADAGVPFFFKQWGEWAPSNELHRAGVIIGHQLHSHPWGICNPQMARAGKKMAGRLLDGKVWDEYPKQRAQA